jgi:hypothetical protein
MSAKVPPIRTAGPKIIPTGPIRADESYSLDDFLARTGWRRAAFRQAKLAGLRFVRAGNRTFIVGRWFHEYLDRLEGSSKCES